MNARRRREKEILEQLKELQDRQEELELEISKLSNDYHQSKFQAQERLYQRRLRLGLVEPRKPLKDADINRLFKESYAKFTGTYWGKY